MYFIHVLQGQIISIPTEDYFRQKLTEVGHLGLQWADTAKKVKPTATLTYSQAYLLFPIQFSWSSYQQVSMDGGALGLEKVFELIAEGEQLPLVCEKELKVIRH